jgi:type IV pilus assembly protein PilF
MLKFASIIFILLMLLSGCVSQNGQSFGQNFDHLKAAKTRVSLGLTYLKNGNYSQAKFNLDKALEFAPRSADANFAMAYYYQNVGELEQAEEAYQFAMDLEPKNANIANSYGAFLCQNGDYVKAKKYFLKAVNTNSYISSAETYENLALCSQSQGRPEEAIQYLRSAVNHQPGRASSLYLLASSLVDTQQWQEAKAILRRFEKISQVSPQSLLMAMKIEKGLGKDTVAKGYSDMLVRLFPNHSITKSMLTEKRLAGKMISKNSISSVLTTSTASDLIEPQRIEKSFTKDAEAAEAAKAAETLEAEEAVKVAKAIEAAETIKAAEALEAAEAIKAAEALEAAEAIKAAETFEAAEAVKVAKAIEAAEALEAAEAIIAAEAFEAAEAVKAAEAFEAAEAVKAAEALEAAEAIKAAEALEAAKAVKAAEALKAAPADETTEQMTEQVTKSEAEVLQRPDFHIVTKGENLYRISLLYNIKMQRLIEWNGLADASAIYDGKKLSLVAPSVLE